jgi:hypothetical protein
MFSPFLDMSFNHLIVMEFFMKQGNLMLRKDDEWVAGDALATTYYNLPLPDRYL